MNPVPTTAAPISVIGFTTCLILAETVRPIRLLQVGLGGWGRDWAWRVIPEVEEVEVVGYVDSDPQSLALLREEIPLAADLCFASLQEAVAATRPEAVLVTTTLPGHGCVTRAAIEAGLHVLVEKPFAPDVDAAGELVTAAASKGVVLMVSQNYRFFPAVRTVARLMEEAPLGGLDQVSIDFRRYSAGRADGRARHHTDEQPLLVDMSIHHFDLLRMLLRREPDRIYCESWNPPWSPFAGPAEAVATIDFGDVVVSYRGSWVSAAPITSWAGEWRMEFERGEIFWTSRDDNGALADKVVVRHRDTRAKTLRLPEMRVDRWGTLTEFASAIRDGREPESAGRENLGTVAFMAAAVESATRRIPVDLRRTRVASRD
jgi:predicted dehydrogenase